MAGRFVVKGINDEQSFCSCCGKQGLKRVVWIEDTETGDINHFGTSCAENPAKAFGVTSEIRKAVREYDKAAKVAAEKARAAEFQRLCQVAESTYGGKREQYTIWNGTVLERYVDLADFLKHREAVFAAAGFVL
jgi:hypothetical protein